MTIALSTLVASLALAVAPAPTTADAPLEPEQPIVTGPGAPPPAALESQTVRLALPADAASPAPPPPRRSVDESYLRRATQERALVMIGTGSVVALGGLLMIAGAAVEASRPGCKFGLDDCPAGTRKEVAIGLGVAGALVTAGGTALLGYGIHRWRAARVGVGIDRGGVALVVGGRF